MNAEELLHLSVPGKRFELIKGGLVEMEPTGGLHGQVAIEIAAALMGHVRGRGMGTVFGTDTGFRLERDPDTVLAPDVAYVTFERLPAALITEKYPELAPDFAGEDRVAERLGEDDLISADPAIPGFAVRLRELLNPR
jgi:Uma2 family endonuclease